MSCCLLLLVLLWGGGLAAEAGGGVPTCRRCSLQLVCNCSHSGFTRVPMVTGRASALDLSCNSIAAVTDGDLTGHRLLKALDLHGNRLSSIQPAAFDPLWSLEELDLSHNQLLALDRTWFRRLGALRSLNLLHNPYRFRPPGEGSGLQVRAWRPGEAHSVSVLSSLGSGLLEGLVWLRTLAFGGPALKSLSRADLRGVAELEELTVDANNLSRYERGALGNVFPLGRVALSLRGPFSTDPPLASAVLHDVAYPETPVTLRDLHLVSNQSVRPIELLAQRRTRSICFQNLSISDQATVTFLQVIDGKPLTSLILDGITLTGEGRLEPAKTNLRSMDEVFIRNLVVLDIFKFFMTANLYFLLQNQRKLSFISSKLFLISCKMVQLMEDVQYLDLTDNLLTDLTLGYMLCDEQHSLSDLRVLNMSGNILKSLSTMSQLVAKLPKLTHLDISRNGYSSMPPACSWPPTLRFLNISRAKLTTITPCLPTSLEVLDLSRNDLSSFSLALPALRELHLSGNKFLRLPSGQLFPNLRTLSIQSNTLNAFGRSDLLSYGRLQTLRAAQNKFICSCGFVHFLQSLLGGGGVVKMADAEDGYLCDSPLGLQGEPVGRVRLSVAECRRVLFVSVSCGVALLVGVLACVLLWKVHAFWYLKMTWAWLRAKRSSRVRRRAEADRGSEALLAFDAFVSYSERDAAWVENFLVPELEEPEESSSHPLSLCLHKRDFLPGRWIMDNIMSAIERSRRTVFVLSENFVQSDWCRYELDFSHFWLFEGGGDAAILILLQPLAKDDVPKRFCKLRKLMSSTTYLEWPQEEGAREEFWRSLRWALRGESN
ncbi:toll-like receptor 2 type-1 [Menidia menidia]